MQGITHSQGSPTAAQYVYPLSQVQQAVWLRQQLIADASISTVSLALKWRSQLDFILLQTAYQQVCDRHPCLKSVYYQQQNELLQRILPTVVGQYERVDATGWAATELEQQVRSAAQTSLDAEAGQVIRLMVFSVESNTHILLFCIHQMAGDRYALLILANELLMVYHSLQEQQEINLPISASYADYVFREQNLLHSADKCCQQYWQQQLAGTLPPLTLPLSRSRALERSYVAASYSCQIPPGLTQFLSQYAQTQQVPLSVVLLVALQVLLYRYTAEPDLRMGWITHAEIYPDFTQTIGNLTNILPLRVPLSDSLTLRDLIQQTQQRLTEAIAHSSYPFTAIARDCAQSSLSHPPICQVAFDYIALTPFQVFQPWNSDYNTSLEFYPLPQYQTEFDVSLVVIDQATTALLSQPFSLNCTLVYNRDLFEAATIERMAHHWQRLLQAIATHPTQPLAQLPLLHQTELHQILVEWNDTKTEYDLTRGLHQWIEAQVERTPEAIAVRFEQQTLTYAELNSRANQLAHTLQKLGVHPETLVGICAERSLQMVIGLLGILKAGGAYIPLDPDYPAERLQMMLADAGMPILLTQSHLLHRLPLQQQSTAKYIICLDRDWQQIAIAADTNPVSHIQPDHLAYVIYTSGSTGIPKGAMNTHRGICNRLLWMQEQYGLTECDRVLQKTPFSFDVSIWEFFWPLMVGAQLVMAVPQGHRDSFYLVNLIVQAQITTLHFVPSMLQVFLDTPGLEQCDCLQRVICSGEALPVSLQQRFFERLNCELHNLYGPTEAAIDVTFWHCQPNPQNNSVPIGRPIANTQLYILDTYLQPVPIGVTGELYISGVGVARGYLNRPELTATRFIANPFSVTEPEEASLLYKTGDLAYFRADGAIEYVGRADNQVKIRGFRIELGEIEQVLTQHEQVREAVVTVFYTSQNQPELIAHVVLYGEVPYQELRDFLKRKLPDYMVPAAVVSLPALPLTPSGKVDRRSLPQPHLKAFIQQAPFVAPRHAVEVQLAQIWSELLEQPSIGVNDDFFDLGGHSLTAMRLMQAIAQQFGQTLPLTTVLTHRTIAEMAIVLQSQSHLPRPPLVAIQTQGQQLPFFCVHPAGGHVLCYANLSRYMGNEHPFYGLQAQGFNGDETPLERVEDMASLYVDAITAFLPEGPYQIGGWSFGGVVAYEMAQQLHQRGQIVSRLAILDSYVPILLDPNKVIDDVYLVGVLSRVFGGMFGLDHLVSPAEIRHLDLNQQIDYIIEKAKASGIFPSHVEQQQNRRILDVLVGTLKATYAYRRRPYPGKVTVFRAREKHTMAPDPQLVWVELFSILDAIDIEIIHVPGNHYSFILEPHVQELARAIAHCLV